MVASWHACNLVVSPQSPLPNVWLLFVCAFLEAAS
jgi:hypothetical protein